MNIKSLPTLFLTGLALLTAGCAQESADDTQVATEPAESTEAIATRAIIADTMREYIRELSDDKYEGRGPGSRGDVAARQYLADELANLGLEPGAADGSWEQPFELVGVTADQPAEWAFDGQESTLTLPLNLLSLFVCSSCVSCPLSRLRRGARTER